MGTAYYHPLQNFLDFMLEEGTISKEDTRNLLFTDNAEEAAIHIRKYLADNYKVVKRKPMWWLFEKA
jgi:hypothetical protein